RGAPASAAARGDGAAGDLRLDRIEEEPPQAFLDAVRTAQRHIAAGDIYQANVSRLWRTRYTGPVAPIYRRLRAANPGPFAALVQLPGLVICSSSPERLLRLRGPELSTRPIAGTRPRSCAPDADALEIGALRASAKEQAEHVMLIDLERNDLGRVAVPGSVRVDEWMITESYRHVHHIVSNVRALLRPELDALAALAALFPGGTITGVPKIRCMQLIAQLESVGRGAYTGSVGYLGRDGHGDFNILIRTLVLAGGELRFRSGAGIVADSDPELELAETRAKARGLLAALGVAA
ncbi:MAG: chorismate-binding protein, partial [Steroidobacteraceae bacterium]|nr:chorismate-binding protein [Steroidobacteraceae bacterium]MDW8259486.1 chorismate-binding protein [Gammaproteobacteria bacterium]